MSLRHAYAPMVPEFDPFLFATVGEEVDGVTLSVLSALTRLGLDPRDEAARLSRLTKEAAADQLARMIARLSDERWTLSEARRIAAPLIERLPTSTTTSKPDPLETGAVPAPLYLALLTALVVGLIASGLLSF
jgi:hypothetical protein